MSWVEELPLQAAGAPVPARRDQTAFTEPTVSNAKLTQGMRLFAFMRPSQLSSYKLFEDQ
jgi:hypothetical protein